GLLVVVAAAAGLAWISQIPPTRIAAARIVILSRMPGGGDPPPPLAAFGEDLATALAIAYGDRLGLRGSPSAASADVRRLDAASPGRRLGGDYVVTLEPSTIGDATTFTLASGRDGGVRQVWSASGEEIRERSTVPKLIEAIGENPGAGLSDRATSP